MTIRSIFRGGLVMALAALFAVTTFAQPADPIQRLSERLDLTAEQQQIAQQHLAERTPGASWHLAAALTPTLTEAQKEALFARPERRQVDRSDMRQRMHQRAQRGERAQRGDRARWGDRAQWGDREQMQARMAAMHAARNEALNLTALQVQQLEALHQERREAMPDRRQQADRGQRSFDRSAMQHRGQLSAQVLEILTDEQAEIWKVHGAIARHAIGTRARTARG